MGMVSTISFIQVNLQHSIAASWVISRTVCVQGIDVALIQEPWYCKGCVRGLNIPGNILFSVGGTDRPHTCILMRNETAWLLPGFSCRDLVAVLIQHNEQETERRLVVSSACLPYDSKHPPLSKELEELVRYCENENLYLVVGCDSNAHHSAWGSTNCNSRGEAQVGFLNSSNLEILNQGNEPTFCSGCRFQVIDITLGSFGLLESIIDWEVSLEPSLSDHRHILFTLRGSVTVRLIRNPRSTNWQQVKVVFIPKPGRNSYSGPRDYRPISLTLFLLKTTERPLGRHRTDEALALVPLHLNQYAYQARKSVETALYQLVVRIEKALDQQESLGSFLRYRRCI